MWRESGDASVPRMLPVQPAPLHRHRFMHALFYSHEKHAAWARKPVLANAVEATTGCTTRNTVADETQEATTCAPEVPSKMLRRARHSMCSWAAVDRASAGNRSWPQDCEAVYEASSGPSGWRVKSVSRATSATASDIKEHDLHAGTSTASQHRRRTEIVHAFGKAASYEASAVGAAASTGFKSSEAPRSDLAPSPRSLGDHLGPTQSGHRAAHALCNPRSV